VTDEARGRLLAAVEDLRVWRRGDERAPHKPLLVLLMLGRLQQGERLVSFADIENDLRGLLTDFGPPRHSYHPEFPFWHLRSDGIWEVPRAEAVRLKRAGSSPPVSQARLLQGGFPVEMWQLLRDDPVLVREVAERLLAAHFPASLHEDVLDRVGLGDLAEAPLRKAQRRDPTFRLRVLRAFEYRCAVCGYDGRLDTTPVGLDAAHVRWWAAGGPDVLENALALCVLHHKAFDLGVVGVSPDRRVQISQAFHGGLRS
jgi:putative restriction endonuclease